MREKLLHVGNFAAAFADIEHGTDQKSHHVVKKAICVNVEDQSALAFTPSGVRYRTLVLVSFWRRSLHGKSAKAASAAHRLRCGGKSVKIKRPPPRQLVPTAKRGRCEIVCAYEVAIAAGNRAIARVELVTHVEGSGNPYIIRKNGVHRSSKRECAPFLWYAHSRSLAARVNSCIRPAGAHDSESFTAKPRDRRFQNALNRPLAGLSLPTGKARAIVVQHELHGSRQHRVKLSPAESLSRNVTYWR